MKNLLTLIFSVFATTFSFGQDYNLLPDTCTYCSFFQNPGGPANYLSTYYLNPELDTTYLGNIYMQIPITDEGYQGARIFGMRQVGNKVFGVAEGDTLQEYLVQDWDLQIGDTIFDLYSNRTYYDAVFINEDSMLLNDGSYHRYREMQGVGYAPNGIYQTDSWAFYWHERGLCAEHVAPYFANSGGLLFNLPGFLYGSAFAVYYLPKPHTADVRYNMNSLMDDCSFTGSLNSLIENSQDQLILYPNPTHGIIQIKQTYHGRIRILNGLGLEIMKFDEEVSQIDLSELMNGMYFLEFTKENGQPGIQRVTKSN